MIEIPENLQTRQRSSPLPDPGEANLLMAAAEMHKEGRFDPPGDQNMQASYDWWAKDDPGATPPVSFMRAGKYVKTGDLSEVEPSKNIEPRGEDMPELGFEEQIGNLHKLQAAQKEYEGSDLSKAIAPTDLQLFRHHLQRLMEIADQPTPSPRPRPKR